MATAHNKASQEDIAKAVLMPGDPLRARYIAEKFLDQAVLVNDVRNMFGYTGMYKGKRITVMGSGMGCGSMGIYSHELFNKYDCDVIIRAGSCGAYAPDLQLKEVIVADSCYSESTYAKTYSGYEGDIVYPNGELCEQLYQSALQHQACCRKGRIHTSDCFYYRKKEDLHDLCDVKGCLGVDMESFALLHNAQTAGKKAAVLLTVSDHPQQKLKLSSDERERSFDEMILIALDVLVRYA